MANYEYKVKYILPLSKPADWGMGPHEEGWITAGGLVVREKIMGDRTVLQYYDTSTGADPTTWFWHDYYIMPTKREIPWMLIIGGISVASLIIGIMALGKKKKRSK